MKNKYYNDAIIGNKNVRATFSKKGELLRLYYPSIDYRQFIDELVAGIKVNDSRLINLADDVNNVYMQKYMDNTNILCTEIKNTYFNLKISQTDFVPMKENVLIKKYVFKNENEIDLNVDLLFHSTLLSDQNNFVSGLYKEEALIQYMHDATMAIFANETPKSFQINDAKSTIGDGEIGGKDYVGLSQDSSISYTIGTIKPGEEKEINILIAIFENEQNSPINIQDEIIRLKKLDIKKQLTSTKTYWNNYLKKHNTITLKEAKNVKEEKIHKIYQRSILLFPLLYNYETGGISAAAEVDENQTKCGRYSYCWPRDAIFITKGMYELGMEKEVEKFYKNFCQSTQSKNGMWEQRFYSDGKLAPSWGYQIDETASVIYGAYTHYQYTKNFKFLKETLPMCEKALDFLKRYVKDLFEQTNKYHVSYDLWEECESIHLYSLSTIYSAFESMLDIYNILGKDVSNFENNRLKDEKISKSKAEIEKLRKQLKLFIEETMYDNEKKCYVRNPKDKKMDISILGSVIPFKVFTPKEKKIENTIERINMSLRTYTGGYRRYEFDNYNGGNPWPLANCWMTLYYLERGENRKAKETFDFVVKTAGAHSFLGEQVDNNTLKPNWVLGLGWSHAMFIIVLEKMFKG